jgi:DNA-binding NtrC family response regulator
MRKLKILLLDDEENIRKSLSTFLRLHNYDVETAARPSQALQKIKKRDFQVLITDVRMPEMDGIQLTVKLKEEFPQLAILVMTAYGNIQDAVAVMKKGAFDYLTKPLNQEELLLALERIREHCQLTWEVNSLRQRLKMESPYEDLVGSSRAIRGIYSLIDKAAAGEFSVLITGETGTGKEMVARAIHSNSPRKGGPLVPVNCGALSETIMESELFGHLKGAFTGAISDRAGKIRSADGGTLFLDEVGTLSPAAQVKLLRVLDDRKLEPVGVDKPVRVDIRILAATNEDLGAAVREGKFREDLYYRLKVMVIDLPPLRERKEDIPLLVRHILRKLDRAEVTVSSGAMNLFLRYDWPGNIRELENVLESTLAMIEGKTLLMEHLPDYIRSAGGIGPPDLSRINSLADKLAAFERQLIEEKLYQTAGNVTRAARELNFPLRSLRRKMEKYSLKAADFKARAGRT